MRILVTAQVFDDEDGAIVWGSLHDEVFVLGDRAPEEAVVDLAARCVTRIEEAKETLLDQMMRTVPEVRRLAEEERDDGTG